MGGDTMVPTKAPSELPTSTAPTTQTWARRPSSEGEPELEQRKADGSAQHHHHPDRFRHLGPREFEEHVGFGRCEAVTHGGAQARCYTAPIT